MGLDGDHLLKRLQPVVRPCGPDFKPRGSGAHASEDFARLIELAANGELVSGRPVSHERTPGLDRYQREQLSRACDALESAGIERGGVLMNDRTFLLDVSGRTVLRELGPKDQGCVQELGGIVWLRAKEDSEQASQSVARLARMAAIPALPPGVLAQLERGSGPVPG